jgi:hypothetical protein
MAKGKRYEKVVDETFVVPSDKGGGIIKFEAWTYQNEIVKYGMAYINKELFAKDNGRVIGYDNAHGYHHKHYFGQITEIDDFTSYRELVMRFKKELKEFISW